MDAQMKAEGHSEREIKKKVKFCLNEKEAGVQANLGKGLNKLL